MSARASQSDRLTTALGYRLERGWALLPIKPGTKEPHAAALIAVHSSPAWKPLAERPASEPEIRAWHEHDPDTSIGIICGRPSGGLVVADFDREANGVSYPPTPVVTTSRGHHAYLSTTGAFATKATPWGELRGDGSYVVAPASVHPSGALYEWAIRPEEADLADLAHLVTPDSPHLLSASQADLSLGRSYGVPLEGVASVSVGEELGKVEAAVAAALPVLGIAAAVGRSFRCVLPGHGEASPSASVFLDERTGVYRYRDWHRRDGCEWYSLAEVLASRRAGAVLRLRGPSASRRWDRLFFEAGLLRVEVVCLPALPLGASPELRCVADGFALLAGLRALRDPREPLPFTRSFAAAWCGVSQWEARKAILELRRLGVIRKLDETTAGGRRLALFGVGEGRRWKPPLQVRATADGLTGRIG